MKKEASKKTIIAAFSILAASYAAVGVTSGFSPIDENVEHGMTDFEALSRVLPWSAGEASKWDGFGNKPVSFEKRHTSGDSALRASEDGTRCLITAPERNIITSWRHVFGKFTSRWGMLHELAHCGEVRSGRLATLLTETATMQDGERKAGLAREIYADGLAMAWLWMLEPDFETALRRASKRNSDSGHDVPFSAFCVLSHDRPAVPDDAQKIADECRAKSLTRNMPPTARRSFGRG